MNDDFKQVLTFSYQEFGDQGMVWVQEQVAAHLSGAAADTSAEDDSDAYEPDGPANETIYDDGEAFSAGTQARMQDLAADSLVSPEHVVDAVLRAPDIAVGCGWVIGVWLVVSGGGWVASAPETRYKC